MKTDQVMLLANTAPPEFDQHGGVLEQGLLRIGLPSGFGDAVALVIKVSFQREGVCPPRQGSRTSVQRGR